MNTSKARETREKKKSARKEQAIQIKEGWRIERADDLNWTILSIPNKHHDCFYGSLEEAIKALPRKILDAEARGSLDQITGCLERIYNLLEELFPTK